MESLGGMPTFRALLVHHLRILLDGKSVPPYSALAWSAARGDGIPRLAIEEAQLQKPNVIFRYKVFEKAPNWQAEAVPILKNLDSRDELELVLPKSERTLSTNRRRFLMWTMGFSLREYVHPMNVGLRNIVYLGSVYRWVHQHLAYSLRLRTESGLPLYLQSIIVPPLAAESIESVFPQAHSIGWSSSSTNYKLFKEKQAEWTIKSKQILRSPERRMTLHALKKKFGETNQKSPYRLTRKDATIIDMVNSTVFYLTHLEKERGLQYWNTTEKEAKRILTNLRNKGVVDISYRVNMGGEFILIAIIVEGQPNSVYSISDALLSGCPTTRTLISDDGSFSINTSRIPIEMRDVFFEDLPRIAKENGITLRPFTVTGFRNFEGSLYQRIIKDDGTYDDDVSNFLSQIES